LGEGAAEEYLWRRKIKQRKQKDEKFGEKSEGEKDKKDLRR